MEDRNNSSAYYLERMNHELELAAQAKSPQIQLIHLEMAERYRGLAGQVTPGAVQATLEGLAGSR